MASILLWFLGSVVSAILAALMYVWRRRMARFITWVDEVLERRFSRFPARYRQRLSRELQFIDLKGLSTLGSSHPELDDVFVDVSLEPRPPHKVAVGVLHDVPSDATGRYHLDDLLDHARPRVLAVLGAHGSGKTTLVRHTARQVCLSGGGRRRRIPILVYLRDHVRDIVANPEITLPTLVCRQLGPLGKTEPAGWFAQRLASGDCVVLLDGLDEVARHDVVAGWVERLTRHHSKNDFVITSRPQGYRTTPIDGATVLQVRGFSDAQVSTFVHGWYRVVEREKTEGSSNDLEERVQHAADDLRNRLENAPSLGDLTVNPLLLTMIANIHRHDGELPGSRVELYRQICQVVLWRRQEAKRLPIEPNGELKEGLLRKLAFTMMCQRVRDLPRDTVLDQLRGSLRHISTALTAEELLADLSSSGLLVERDRGPYSFAHLTFQEYLAAVHVRDTGKVEVLAEAVDDVWWRDTTLLYTAITSTADDVVSACLESGSVTALALASDVVEDYCLAPELQRRLEEQLDTWEDDPERRHVRNGVLVTRSLRHAPVRTRAGARVCRAPVSRKIYGLFMRDRRVPAPDVPAADQVTGVWARDAVEFVTWVNEVTDGLPGYRLVTSAELDELRGHPLVHNTGFSVWTNPDVGGPQLWTPDQDAQPHRVDDETILNHVRADMTSTIPTLVYLALLKARLAGPDHWRNSEAAELASALIRELFVNETYDHPLGMRQERGIFDSSRQLHADDLVKKLDTALSRDGDLDDVIDLARELVRQLPRARELDLAVDIAGPRDLDMVAHALQPFLDQVTETDNLLARTNSRSFADKFIDDTRAGEAARVVALDKLEETIRKTTVETRMRSSVNAIKIAEKLTEVALPIAARTEQVTSDLATAIRITALSLAADASRAGADDISDKYREIAAGITLMERRAIGHAQPTETLILAMS